MTVVDTLIRTAVDHPNRTAVVAGPERFTYHELEYATGCVASSLRRRGVTPGAVVAVVADRGAATVVAMYGVMRAGAAYLPVEKHQAAAFKNHVDRLQPALTLTVADGNPPWGGVHVRLSECLESRPREVPPEPPSSDARAYTMFTSGSTGPAKAVGISYRNLDHYLTGLFERLPLAGLRNFACVSSLSADLGNTVLFGALAAAGCVHIVPDAVRNDGVRFEEYLRDEAIDVLKITPSHLRSLIDWEIATQRRALPVLVLGGERLERKFAMRLRDLGWAECIVNHYGPTEATIGAALYVLSADSEMTRSATDVPIGYPIGQAMLELVDAAGTRVDGVGVGELLIGGPGVSEGYLNDATLTRERFVERNFGAAGPRRAYRTGDLCRRHDDGALEFLHRKDRQVKVRGFRVDPTAVEAALRTCEGVADAAVVPLESDSSITLAATIVWDATAVRDTDRLRSMLGERLPAHMVPNHLVTVRQIPLNSNGKTDLATVAQIAREVLRDSSAIAPGAHQSTAATRLEDILADLWRRYVGREDIGYDDSFMEVGGDSLAAIQIIGELRRRGYQASVESLRETTTVRVLAATMASGATEKQEPIRESASRSVEPETVLGPLQRWLLDRGIADVDHWNQAVAIEVDGSLNAERAERVINAIVARHQLLRTRYVIEDQTWRPVVDRVVSVRLTTSVLHGQGLGGRNTEFARVAAELHSEIRVETGPITRWHLVHDADANTSVLLIVAHHLAVDGLSWRIIVEEFVRLYMSDATIVEEEQQSEDASYWSWARVLAADVDGQRRRRHTLSANARLRDAVELATEAETSAIWMEWNEDATQSLQRAAGRRQASIEDLLTAALVIGLESFLTAGPVRVLVEGHGRSVDSAAMDVTRAVGWFTAAARVVIPREGPSSMDNLLGELRASERTLVPGPPSAENENSGEDQWPDLCVNYVGRFAIPGFGGRRWRYAREYIGPTRGSANLRAHRVVLTGRILDERLIVDIAFNPRELSQQRAEQVAAVAARELSNLCDRGRGFAESIVAPPAIWADRRPSAGLLANCPASSTPRRTSSHTKAPRAILLTGATGFLGMYLLRELLKKTTAEIHVLVRAPSEATARERIANEWFWHFSSAVDLAWANRLRIATGEITAPRLGLDDERYCALATEVDMVIHAAADVRLMVSRETLAGVNVEGTRNVVQFCTEGIAKELHHISTLSVAGRAPSAGPRVFSEADTYYGQEFLNGYEETKFQSELVAAQYAASGAPVYVYRVGSIVAASDTGRFQRRADKNRLLSTLRGYVELGCAAEAPDEVMHVAHVDHVARDIVTLAISRTVTGGTFHIGALQALRHDEVIEQLNQCGYSVRLVPLARFRRVALARNNGIAEPVPLVAMWVERRARNVTISGVATEHLLSTLEERDTRLSVNWLQALLDTSTAGDQRRSTEI